EHNQAGGAQPGRAKRSQAGYSAAKAGRSATHAGHSVARPGAARLRVSLSLAPPRASGDELLEAGQVHVSPAGDDDDVPVLGRLDLAGEERGSGGGAGGLDQQLRALQEEREGGEDLRVRDEDDVVHERAHVLQRVRPDDGRGETIGGGVDVLEAPGLTL